MTDKEYMAIALEEAGKAALADETPVGAVLVNPQTGEIISQAHNQTEYGNDPSAHAEIIVLREACRKLQVKRLWGMDLYVTLEPCTMCAAAISYARIKRLVYGAEDPKGGAVANGVKFYESPTCHHRPEIAGKICAEESGKLLKDFFKKKRKNQSNNTL